MADSKITALTPLSEMLAMNDLIPVVNVSNTSMAASGTDEGAPVGTVFATLNGLALALSRNTPAM